MPLLFLLFFRRRRRRDVDPVGAAAAALAQCRVLRPRLRGRHGGQAVLVVGVGRRGRGRCGGVRRVVDHPVERVPGVVVVQVVATALELCPVLLLLLVAAKNDIGHIETKIP